MLFDNNLLYFNKLLLTNIDLLYILQLRNVKYHLRTPGGKIMSQTTLSKWLKGIIIGLAACGAVICFFIVPSLGKDLAYQYPEFAYCYRPWLIAIWIAVVPCYFVLYYGWKITIEIGKDNSFSKENARYLKQISMLAIVDTGYFFLFNIIFLLLNMSHPGVLLASLFVDFAGVAITIVAAGLSHLVQKAAEIQSENKLTI